jgi:serine/threonine protein kinase
MTLQPGAKLGHYEIVSALGAGGMGEVYRAEDSKLGRQVAIKLLLEEVASDPERLARFDREARLLASLNHPNVATLHGAERDGDTHFLVMELVEGETLADRISRGALPVAEAIDVFVQIAEGLAAAHESGVIHRDLKPANIKLTGEEDRRRVKILDFGLARAMGPEPAPSSDVGASASPTLTLAATMRGEILGTAAYMSPEQASGKAVDERTDIWAFGACLYEALTGRRAFRGEDAPNTLAAVLRDEIDFETLPSDCPLALRRCLERCMVRDRHHRFHDIADARLELEATGEEEHPPISTAAPARTSRFLAVGTGLAGLAVGLVAMAIIDRGAVPSRPENPNTTRSRIATPDRAIDRSYGLALSPDGRTLVYVARVEGNQQLHQRSLDSLHSAPIEGTEGTNGGPFFSPDGEWIAHLSRNLSLVKVPIEGGLPVSLIQGVLPNAGGDWWSTPGGGGSILFAHGDGTIHRIDEDGGPSTPVTTLRDGETVHDAPRFLDAETIGFSIFADGLWVAVKRLDEEDHVRLHRGRRPRLLESGHLLFGGGGGLRVAPFDLEALAFEAQPRPLTDAVVAIEGVTVFDSTLGGEIAYPDRSSLEIGPLVWVDRLGRESPVGLPNGAYAHPRVAPQSGALAFLSISGAAGFGRPDRADLFVLDPDSSEPRPVGRGSNTSLAPLWRASDDRLFFAGWSFEDFYTVWELDTEEGRSLGPLDTLWSIEPGGFAADGRIVVSLYDPEGSGSLVLFDPTTGEKETVAAGAGARESPSVSPDGTRTAFPLLRNGRFEVHTASLEAPLPEESSRVAEGRFPLWIADDELVFVRGNALYSQKMQANGLQRIGDPHLLFEGPYFDALLYSRPYDYDPRSDRFLAMRRKDAPSTVVLVQNVLPEVRRLFEE